MLSLLLAGWLAFAAPPALEVDMLSGERLQGELVELTETQLVLKSGTDSRAIPLAQVLELRQPRPPVPIPKGPRVELTDGTRLAFRDVTVARDKAVLVLHGETEIPLPANRLASIRLGESTPALDDAWKELAARESKSDLLVIRKEDVLDFVPGVIGEFGEKLSFLVDQEELPVAREKVYGLIYRRRNTPAAKNTLSVGLATGDQLKATEVLYAEETFRVKLAGNTELRLPAEQVVSLDLSAGKVKYLSTLEPREVTQVPFFDLPREVERDRSLLGTPLTLGGRVYARGLGIFPQTRLKYRVAGEYSRFRAVAGIDDLAPRLKTSVKLQVLADKRSLFEAELAPGEAPKVLDLDIAGARDLEILVDFGADQLNIGDFLDLADAKLTR